MSTGQLEASASASGRPRRALPRLSQSLAAASVRARQWPVVLLHSTARSHAKGCHGVDSEGTEPTSRVATEANRPASQPSMRLSPPAQASELELEPVAGSLHPVLLADATAYPALAPSTGLHIRPASLPSLHKREHLCRDFLAALHAVAESNTVQRIAAQKQPVETRRTHRVVHGLSTRVHAEWASRQRFALPRHSMLCVRASACEH